MYDNYENDTFEPYQPEMVVMVQMYRIHINNGLQPYKLACNKVL